MRIAVTRWDDKVSPLFESAAWLLVVEIDRDGICGRFEAGMRDLAPIARVRLLRGLHVDLLICGAIGRDTRSHLETAGLQVVNDICGRWEDAIKAFLANDLNRLRIVVDPTPGDAFSDMTRSGFKILDRVQGQDAG